MKLNATSVWFRQENTPLQRPVTEPVAMNQQNQYDDTMEEKLLAIIFLTLVVAWLYLVERVN